MDHSQKRELEGNYASVVIGTLLGTVDGKIINISNSFPMNLKTEKAKEGGNRDDKVEYIFDTDYLKKMLKFHRRVNELEGCLGVYISSTNLDQ